jgi:hypothetical protein
MYNFTISRITPPEQKETRAKRRIREKRGGKLLIMATYSVCSAHTLLRPTSYIISAKNYFSALFVIER